MDEKKLDYRVLIEYLEYLKLNTTIIPMVSTMPLWTGVFSYFWFNHVVSVIG